MKILSRGKWVKRHGAEAEVFGYFALLSRHRARSPAPEAPLLPPNFSLPTTLPFSYDCCIFVPKNVAAGQSFPHGSCVPALVPPRRVPLAAPAASFPRRRMLLGVSPSERFAFLGVSARASETDWRHHDVTPPLIQLAALSPPLSWAAYLFIYYWPKGPP